MKHVAMGIRKQFIVNLTIIIPLLIRRIGHKGTPLFKTLKSKLFATNRPMIGSLIKASFSLVLRRQSSSSIHSSKVWSLNPNLVFE